MLTERLAQVETGSLTQFVQVGAYRANSATGFGFQKNAHDAKGTKSQTLGCTPAFFLIQQDQVSIKFER